MVRDMNVGVRVEVFIVFGKIGFVFEDILLQIMFKKVFGIIKEKKLLVLCRARLYEIYVFFVVGVFIYGLEDEYGEVKLSLVV